MPSIGVSRTFINNSVYSVGDDGKVKEKIAGDWRIVGGVSSGIGKNFKNDKGIVRNVFIRLNNQILYPNFRSIAIESSFVAGITINIQKVIIPYKNRVIINRK